MLGLCAPPWHCGIFQHLLISPLAPCCLLLILGVSIILKKNCMSFTIATVMIFTTFTVSLATDTGANQDGFGAWCKERDGNETINTQCLSMAHSHCQWSHANPFDHNCAAQLHSTLPNVYSTDVSSSPSSFLAGSTVDKYQLLGQAVLSRLGTVSNSIV